MSEPFDTNEQEGGKIRKRGNRPGNIDYSSQKPWWLVVLIVIALLAFGVYIRKTNAPVAEQKESFWSFFKNKNSVVTDSLGIIQDTLPSTKELVSAANPGEIGTVPSGADGWETPVSSGSPPPAEESIEDQATTNSPTQSSVEVNSPSEPSGVTYCIIAGEFKDKKEAVKRMQEIRQGNYPALVIDPTDPAGKYQVVAGEFKNLRTAESKAEALGFILEIKTRVEKKGN